MPEILCVPRCSFDLHDAGGFVPDPSGELVRAILADGWALRERTPELEADESWVQVVAVVVATWNGKVFAYERRGSEGRLTGKTSVLIGGHVEASDLLPAVDLRADGPDPDPYHCPAYLGVCRAAAREFREEAGRVGSLNCFGRAGLIYSGASAVSRVHLGVVFEQVLVAEPRVSGDGELAGGSFADPGRLLSRNLEDWSRLAIEGHLLKGVAA